MKAKIKGEWVAYDYAINTNLSTLDMVLNGLKENGKEAEFLGRSKAVMDPEGKVTQLHRRSMFFKFKTQSV